MKAVSVLALLIVLSACHRDKHADQQILVFKKPKISQPATTRKLRRMEVDSLVERSPLFMGKFKFCNTLYAPVTGGHDTSYWRDFRDPRGVYYSDSLMTDGFEIIPDYQSTIYRDDYDSTSVTCYYPLYIVNQTPSVKTFVGKDDHIFGLQEAEDSDGWHPIEGKPFDFCGNGYWALNVNPREFIAVLLPKYAGNYYTKIRVRIVNDGNIYLSKAFDAMINRKQFTLKKDCWFYRQLLINKSLTIQSIFYGTMPQGSDDKIFGPNHCLTD